MKELFQPFEARNLKAKNRLVRLRVYPNPEMAMRKLIKVQTRRGVQLDGVLFSNGGEQGVVIVITGIHGNFYSNPMYYNIGDTLSDNGIAFVYAQTNDAFNKMETFNTKTGGTEIIGSYNECFDDICDDISAYVGAAKKAGYAHILLAGHSLGANKVILYLANAKETPVEHYILVSPANMKYMLANVPKEERAIIRAYVEAGRAGEMLPFPFMGWAPMVAGTAWQWLFKNPLDNVHSDPEGDFSEVARIRQSGALIIGTYDRFSYGEPRAFIELINAHTQAPEKTRSSSWKARAMSTRSANRCWPTSCSASRGNGRQKKTSGTDKRRLECHMASRAAYPRKNEWQPHSPTRHVVLAGLSSACEWGSREAVPGPNFTRHNGSWPEPSATDHLLHHLAPRCSPHDARGRDVTAALLGPIYRPFK